MNHHDHIQLIRPGVMGAGKTWADLGSGTGAFTLALRDILGAGARIFSIDFDGKRLAKQKQVFAEMFPDSTIQFIQQNFQERIDLPLLDGIVMANSLHFTNDKMNLLIHVLSYLKENGVFILVEYNTDFGNQWVPYPISFESFQNIAREIGLREPVLIGRQPSQFLGEIYAAQATKQ